MSSRQGILDRNKYSPRTISTYQVISAYVVNVYYNLLYAEAIKLKNAGSVSSITEGYKHTVFAFLSAIDSSYKKTYKPKSYNELLIDINKYFTACTSFETLTLADCINKITREFVPSDYFKSLSKDHKRNILRIVLTGTIKEFSKSVVRDYIGMIIDDHDEKDNIEVLKEKIVDILLMERESFYHKFLNKAAGRQSQQIDKGIAVKMQNEIKKLNNEKRGLLRNMSELKQTCDVRTKQLSQVISKYKKLVSNFKTLKMNHEGLILKYNSIPQQNDELKQQLNNAKSHIQKLTKKIEEQNAIIEDLEAYTEDEEEPIVQSQSSQPTSNNTSTQPSQSTSNNTLSQSNNTSTQSSTPNTLSTNTPSQSSNNTTQNTPTASASTDQTHDTTEEAGKVTIEDITENEKEMDDLLSKYVDETEESPPTKEDILKTTTMLKNKTDLGIAPSLADSF